MGPGTIVATSEVGEKWEDSSSILKVEPIELDGLDRELEKKKAMKSGANVMPFY